MSKKKSFSGSTMTLKDFHGGSIPSDLSLPSAPGVSTVRPPDRPGYDRLVSGSWGPAGRPDLHHHRPRPGSSGGAAGRGLDERGPPFLPHIGRHFDEDERKPFDSAATTPRRPAPDPPIRPSPPPALISPHHPHASAPVPAFHPPSGTAPNAWAARKEAGGYLLQPSQPTTTLWSGPGAATRLAQASAIEKVSSGRWQSKPPPDVEVIRLSELETLDRRLGESIQIVDDEDHSYERERATHLAYRDSNERNSVGLYYDRVRSPVYPEAKERNPAVGFYSDNAGDHGRARSPLYPETKERNASSLYPDGRLGVSHLPQQGMVEVLERPKLKLLPKTKGLEPLETRISDDKQGYMDPVQIEKAHEMHGNTNVLKPGLAGPDVGNQTMERLKLNLKPRSLPVEQSDETAERERRTVFGGARPRELVLKERGVDSISVNNFDDPSPTNRVKSDIPKINSKLDPAAPANCHGERAQNYSLEQRSGRDLERKDYRLNSEKVDVQRTSWRNDNRRNSRETEKALESQRQEPDSWRKPVEQPKPDAPGTRFGKAASPLELARAFSRSVSDPKIASQSLPGRTQVPFSRLTDTRKF